MITQFYINECPETNRIFICEREIDNNFCEVFARNTDETARDNAVFICELLNKDHEQRLEYYE